MHKIESRNIDFFYGETQALHDISLSMKENTVTALIGPSGCGKSTFLRSLNRMNDYIESFRLKGKVNINGKDIYDKDVRVEVRDTKLAAPCASFAGIERSACRSTISSWR